MNRFGWHVVAGVAGLVAMVVVGTAVGQLQPVISLTGPAVPGGPSPTLGLIPAGGDDLLITATPPPAPAPPLMFLPGVALGIVGGGPGGPADMDAVSLGRTMSDLMGGMGVFYFSVDRFAMGLPGAGPAPGVLSEAAMGEASADIFLPLLPPIPLPKPPGMIGPNAQQFDGDGVGSFQGMGLIEVVAAPGDDIDAMDLAVWRRATPHVFFSLDPWAGAPINGVLPGDVLVAPGGVGPFIIFAPAPMIGLDIVGGPNTDDLDALVVIDQGADAMFVPGFDVVLFSVRAGSAVIGMPDCLFGAPITPGDVLIDPAAAGVLFGPPVSPFPGILVSAESLGLQTMRLGLPNDDLDALDLIGWPMQGLMSTDPTNNGTLPKTRNNVFNLVFGRAIAMAPMPPNPVTFRQLITSVPQVLGPDISGNFTYSLITTNPAVPNDTLKGKENGAVLPNLTWYRILPTANLVDAASGISVPPILGFPYDVCTLRGDADGNGTVLAQDYFPVKNNLFLFTDRRFDLDGNGQVLAQDYFVVKNNLFMVKPAKP